MHSDLMVWLSLLILPYNYNTSHYFMNPILHEQKKGELSVILDN